ELSDDRQPGVIDPGIRPHDQEAAGGAAGGFCDRRIVAKVLDPSVTPDRLAPGTVELSANVFLMNGNVAPHDERVAGRVGVDVGPPAVGVLRDLELVALRHAGGIESPHENS